MSFFFKVVDGIIIIHAIILRDLAVRQKNVYRSTLLSIFAMPALVIGFHYILFVSLQKKMPGNMPMEIFLIGGFGCWFTFRNMAAYSIFSLGFARHKFISPNIKFIHSILARLIWEIIVGFAVILAGLLIAYSYTNELFLPKFISLFHSLFVASLLGLGYQLAIDGLSIHLRFLKFLKKILTWAIFITSGIYFEGNRHASNYIESVTWYNPLSHVLGFSRNAIFEISGEYIDRLSFEYSYFWVLALIAMGSISYSAKSVRTI